MLDPPCLEYLLECSETSLRLFEISRLDHVAGMKKEARALLELLVEEAAAALLARWLIENRTRLAGCTCGLQKTLDFADEAVADRAPTNGDSDGIRANAAHAQR